MFTTAREATEYRRTMCQIIAHELRRLGYDVTPQRVNRNYIVMRRWYHRQLSLGYLIRLTGIKRIRQG